MVASRRALTMGAGVALAVAMVGTMAVASPCLPIVCSPDDGATASFSLTQADQAVLDAHDRTIVVGFDNYPPYIMLSNDNQIDGFAGGYFRHVAELLDVTIEPRTYGSFAETMTAIENGEPDVVPFIERTVEREEYLAFTDVIMVNQDHIFVGEANEDVTGVEDLLGLRVAAVDGYAVVDRLAVAYPEIDLELVASELDGLIQLNAGEIDALLAGVDVALYHIRESGWRDIRHVGPLEGVGVDELRFATPSDRRDLRDVLSRALGAISPEQEAELRERWTGAALPAGGRVSREVLVAAIAVGALFGVAAILATLWSRSLRRLVRRRTGQLEDELERHRATEQERLRLIYSVEQAADVVVLADADQRVTYVNPALAHLTEVDTEAMIGRPIGEHLIGHGAEGAWLAPRVGEPWTGVVSVGGVEFAASIAVVQYADGGVAGTVATLRDTRVEQGLRDELLQSQSLAAVGVLAAGIAHDFNNLLTPIRLSADMLADYPPREQHNRLVRRIVAASKRGSDLVDHLRDLQGVEDHAQPVDIAAVASEVVDLLAPTAPNTVTVTAATPKAGAIVSMSPQRAHHAVVNLVKNAIDAVGEGPGEVSVVVELLDDTPRPDGPFVRLTVADNGAGLSDEAIRRAFEPYYTSRAAAGGTGLGLFTVRQTVEAAGGSVMLKSGQRRGAVVTIVLPGSDDDPADLAGVSAGSEGRQHKVLVVDDDALVLDVLEEMIKQLGHHTDHAHSAAEAKRVIASHDFDVLITDLSMPGEDGEDLAAWMEDHHPEVGVFILTGQPNPETRVSRHRRVVRKPLSSDDLQSEIIRAAPK